MTRLLAALLALFLLATPTLAEGTLEEAIAAYDAGDYEKAYALFLPLAEAGDAEAQYSIGFMLARGEGVPENEADGIVWLEKAVAQGHVKASFIIGLLYTNGSQTPENRELAVLYFERAARRCHSDAAAALGIELLIEKTPPGQKVEAFAWLYVSLAWGSLDGQSSLGAAYLYCGKDIADRGKERAKSIEAELSCAPTDIVHN